MNPSVQDRLGSVLRALSGVILPALPKDAGLAQEQAMLAMGHIQIILAQMDAAPAFEAGEADDLTTMAEAIAALAAGGAATQRTLDALRSSLTAHVTAAPATRTAALQDAIDALLCALASDGDADARAAVNAAVLNHGAARSDKDRRWFAAMGFDIDYSGG
jgi:hypothetical protein